VIAHNATFDVDMLKKEGIKPDNVICTLKLARHFD
jgi:DNA polymerase III epsilon subunit-like protein